MYHACAFDNVAQRVTWSNEPLATRCWGDSLAQSTCCKMKLSILVAYLLLVCPGSFGRPLAPFRVHGSKDSRQTDPSEWIAGQWYNNLNNLVLWLLFTLRFGSNKDLDFCQNSNKSLYHWRWVDLHWHGYVNVFPICVLSLHSICILYMVPLLTIFHALMQIKLAILPL